MVAQNCRGVIHTGAACRLSRAHPGQAISIRGTCIRCVERRCRSHCRCGRQGTAVGLQAGRPGAGPAPIHVVPPVAVPGPVGAPNNLAVEVLPTLAWFRKMIFEISVADEVLISSLMMDYKPLVDELLRRLGGHAAFEAAIMVDRQAFQDRLCYHQRPRLDALRRAGAGVYLCRGSPPLGRLHTKAVLIDRRYGYVGSANLTQKSLSNTEFVMRVVGPPADKLHESLVLVKNGGVRWHG